MFLSFNPLIRIMQEVGTVANSTSTSFNPLIRIMQVKFSNCIVMYTNGFNPLIRIMQVGGQP